ncbi:hypothetical protein PYW08_009502 [Mythimna loreyi]|uniref:Uncharacterized protein n=1 Tax=Mythimna loreyi TaxID=667449 RepID=A0ACC2Q7X3_9NEOP|nr:hypothetical protein PYW08_009502 [Mythimna loreyi]
MHSYPHTFNISTDIFLGIADPDDANTVANACLQKHFLYKVAHPYLGQGLFTGSGPVWKHHRKVLSPAFSIPVINGFFDVFNSQSRRMVSELEEQAGKEPFDHVMLMRDSILRISCITAFGDTEDKGKDFVKDYVNAVDELAHILMNRLNKVWYQSDLIYKLAGLKKRETELVNFLNLITDKVINRKKDLLKNGNNNTETKKPSFRSFLDIVLELTANESFTEDEMRQELNTMVAAAFETTSQQLVFILTMIGSYPKVQEQVFEEVMEVIGGDRDVEKEDLPKLVYTEAVIKEILRLVAVAPLVPRYIDKDVKLKNYTLRAGSQVFFMPHGLHRTKVWGDNPEEFKPERWFDSEKLPQMNKSFAAFSLGKRSCIGRAYAMTSMKIILAHLVRQLRWTADHTKMQLGIDVTLRSTGGHEIVVERRISNNNYQMEKFYKSDSIIEALTGDSNSFDPFR